MRLLSSRGQHCAVLCCAVIYSVLYWWCTAWPSSTTTQPPPPTLSGSSTRLFFQTPPNGLLPAFLYPALPVCLHSAPSCLRSLLSRRFSLSPVYFFFQCGALACRCRPSISSSFCIAPSPRPVRPTTRPTARPPDRPIASPPTAAPSRPCVLMGSS